MHGGVKFYRGSARAARAYVEADHSRADDYYLAEGSGLATRYVAGPDDVVAAGELSGDAYEQWVAGHDVETGAAKGRLRDDANALRFVEVTINGPKTWSLAAALHPEISTALDAAQDRAAEQIIGWLAQHATTRVGPRSRQVQVPVEQIEAVVIRHYTSRAGDPHRHLHLQVNARVFAEGTWRGLHSVGVRDMIEAINGIGHAAVATDPEFRAALAAYGFTVDTADSTDTGCELVELAPYVGRFSARANQIRRNIDRYEAEWRAAHPDQEPGPQLREAWDRGAWAQARPDKVVSIDGVAMVAQWNEVLHAFGYRDPIQVGLPIVPAGPRVGALDRDRITELVVAELGAEHSAWNTADIRGRVEKHLAATGLVVEAAVRIEFAEDITARATARCVRLVEDPGVPEHLRSLTSQQVLDVEADLVAAMAGRATEPGLVAALAGTPYDLDQHDAVAALAGTSRLVVVEGAAGAGKTTTLAAVRHELDRQGRRVVVVTPTLKAAQVAAHETRIDATSAAGLANEFGWRWDDAGHWSQQPRDATESPTVLGAGDLLLVDEAGMLDQDTALALFRIAEQTGARVALVGDRHQLPAVGRGGVLDLAARWAHPDCMVGLDVVHRFADPAYADISLAMRHGVHAEEVFDQLWDRGQIRLHASEAERLHAIATETADRIAAGHAAKNGDSGRAGMVVMADTLAQVSLINGIIRDRLVATGHVDDTHTVATNAGERIGVGDQVATRLNDHHLGVANRDLWTVTAISPDGTLTLTPAAHNRLAGHAPVRDVREVPGWYVATRVELAYATTVYGAQGETTGTGHLLLSEATSGSAAYVGMTRGRDHNVAHLVATDLDEARAIWCGVMGRDRADLGPAHAAKRVVEEMERYAPQRPREVVLDRLRGAWTRRADLTERAADLARHQADIEAVLAIRARHDPHLRQLHEEVRATAARSNAAAGALKALEATMASEQRDLLGDLLDHWHREHLDAYQAAAVLRTGPGRPGRFGPFGQNRRQIRDARDTLTSWAQRWRPILPDLATEPEAVRRDLDAPPEALRGECLRQAFAGTARQTVAQAHPEAEPLRTEAATTQQAAEEALGALTTLHTRLGEQLRPYRWARARADALPRALAEIRGDLEAIEPVLEEARQEVERLRHAPEIRSLLPGQLDTEHDRWQADRTAAQEAERAAVAQAAERRQLEAEQARRHGVIQPTAHSRRPTCGPTIGL